MISAIKDLLIILNNLQQTLIRLFQKELLKKQQEQAVI